MTFKFKTENVLVVYNEDNEVMDSFALPLMSKGIDLINFGEVIEGSYTENIDALVIICDGFNRKAYYRGTKVADTNSIPKKYS